MTWSLETSDGNESRKIRFEILPYVRGLGLDLGCGPWKVFPHVIGIDAQAYPNAPSGANFCGDITDLRAFADEAYEWVYSSHALEDLADTVGALKEWWRKVKVGGCLILYLPHKDFYPNIGQPGANPAHKHDFVPQDIVDAMRQVSTAWDLEVCQERNGGNEYSFLQIFRKHDRIGQTTESWRNPKPGKTAAVVRYGAYGDALWASSILPPLKAEGYHVTVYTQEPGAEILRSDPHVDRIIIQDEYLTPGMSEMSAYWLHEKPKYDRWINLTHSVEARLLPTPNDVGFYWPDGLRRARMGENYLEAVHEWAGMPYEPRQKFYPTADEAQWAQAKRAEFDGPVVVLNPMGSTWPKWWPYTEAFAAMLAEREIHCVVLGDYRGEPPKLPERFGHFVGPGWTIRQAMAFAALADVVVGQESALVNAVAFEAPFKVVLLSHSLADNLTRDWPNTVAIEPQGMPCYPCHRIHADHLHCTLEKRTQSAGCQAIALPQKIADVVDDYFTWLREREAA